MRDDRPDRLKRAQGAVKSLWGRMLGHKGIEREGQVEQAKSGGDRATEEQRVLRTIRTTRR